MPEPRFFLLDEPCPASEIPSMMCRVAANKTLPLFRFAPVEPLSPDEARHNTNDIITGILPEPTLTTNRRDFISRVRDAHMRASLSLFFGVDLERTTEESVSLETQEVKRYSLSNPHNYFRTLMANELYARDVHDLLRANYGRAYLVIGFDTTTGATWTHSRIQRRTADVDVTAPVTQLATGLPLPLPPGLDANPSISPGISLESSTDGSLTAPGEEIFAVAYAVVKVKYSLSGRAQGFVSRTAVVGPPKRAKAHHLAMGRGSESEEEEEEQREEVLFLALEDLEGSFELEGVEVENVEE
jgi:hypothetical protein